MRTCEPALSKSDSSWDNSYCVTLVVVSLAVNLGVSATKMKCLLISSLNYIRNINFFVFSFLKYRGFMFFVISIFVVAKEHVVNSKYIFMLFLAFVQHFLVYLSELFWSEFARAATFIMLLPFCFGALNLSIYLPAIYLQICLYEVICFQKQFYQPKHYHLSKRFIVKIRFKQRLYTNFIGLCRYVLSSKNC